MTTRSCVSRATLVAAALVCAATALADSCGSSTIKHYTRRSDSRHKYRQWAGNVSGGKIDKFEAESWYGIISLTPGFAGTFKPDNIADCLFGDCCCDSDCCDGRVIKVQGTSVDNRDSKAWLADYFYLPTDYDGCFKVDPRIKTFFMDIDFYLGMDEWLSGMYFRMYGTVVHTNWDLNFCDQGHTASTSFADHTCGYFSQNAYDHDKLLQSFAAYMCGNTPQDSAATDPANSIKWNGLKYARMSTCARKETGFADLRFELGWNFLNCEDYHLGIDLQGAAPTGVSKSPCYLFDAMVGNGGFGELGAGLHGHYTFWRSEEGDRHCTFLADVNVTHLFKKRQCRTFDLSCNPNSAYMLAAKFATQEAVADNPATLADTQIGYGTTSSATPVATASVTLPNPNKHFASEYAPVANLSTINVDVRASAQVDLVVMFNYTCENFSWDLGYDFWTRTCEKYDCVDSCNKGNICDSALKETWALKGDARMFGFQGVTVAGPALPAYATAVPLSATQSTATINAGLNQVAPGDIGVTNKDINAKVDSAQFAYTKTPGDVTPEQGPVSLTCDTARFLATAGAVGRYLSLGAAGDVATDQIKTSTTPKFLSCASLSMARTKGVSHSLFTHLSWTFDREDWTPYLGVGAAAEFGQKCGSCDDCGDCCTPCCTTTSSSSTSSSSCNSCCCDPCGPCLTCATSEWRIWVKGGLAFG